jgi:hypothetical protein
MGTVHQLIEAHGRRGALSMDIDRRVVDAAAEFMADEEGGIGFLFFGWAQAALPHKRLPDDAPWQVQTERVMLLVQPGRRAVRDSAPVPIGVPYGSRAWLIMLCLQTEAIQTNSREVELGKSLRSWLAKMDIAWGGKTVKDVREQAERISHCSLSFQINQGGRGAGYRRTRYASPKHLRHRAVPDCCLIGLPSRPPTARRKVCNTTVAAA